MPGHTMVVEGAGQLQPNAICLDRACFARATAMGGMTGALVGV